MEEQLEVRSEKPKGRDLCLLCYQAVPEESTEAIRTSVGAFCNDDHYIKFAGYLYLCEEARAEAQRYPKREIDTSLAQAYYLEVRAVFRAAA